MEVLILIIAIPTCFLWRLDRRPEPGHCRGGDNLRGDVSGTCPECGREAAIETGWSLSSENVQRDDSDGRLA